MNRGVLPIGAKAAADGWHRLEKSAGSRCPDKGPGPEPSICFLRILKTTFRGNPNKKFRVKPTLTLQKNQYRSPPGPTIGTNITGSTFSCFSSSLTFLSSTSS